MIGEILTGSVVATTPSPKKLGANNGLILKFANGELGFLYFRRCAGDTFEAQLQTLELLQPIGTKVEVLISNKTRITLGGEEVEVYRCSQDAAVRRRAQEFCVQAATDKVVFDARVTAVRPQYAVVDLKDGIPGVLHATRFACSPEEALARLSTLAVGETIKVVITEPNGYRRVRVSEAA